MRQRVGTAGLWLALAVACAAPAGHAEISFRVLEDMCSDLIVMGIIEDVDPVGSTVWLRLRDDPRVVAFNDSGALRGDGAPEVALAFPACGGYVVWAFANNDDYDIAFAEWDGVDMPSPPSFLTSGLEDELDPDIFAAPDGSLYVVWWTDAATAEVSLAERPLGAGWSLPLPVTGTAEAGRRPSVAVHAGQLYVAYERDSSVPGMAQDVVVARREADGTFARQVVASTARSDRLDVELHAEGGRLWVDWKQAADQLAAAELVGSAWSASIIEPWTDPSWVGVETARKIVRRRILSP